MTVEIDGANNIVKTNTISEVTSANGVTVDGLSIKDSKLVTADSVIEANMSANSVDSDSYVDASIDAAHLSSNVITGQTALTSVANDDLVLLSDTSGSAALKKMTVANLVANAGGTNTPYFQVYKNADQVIANASFVTVTFETEQFDSGGNFASNTFTAPSAGYYFIYSQLVWSGGTDSNYSLNRLMKNGSAINWVAWFQDSSSGGFGGRVVHLSASDTVTVQTYQQSGGNLSLRGSSEDECQFGGYKLIT
jgi:hypothetical protein